MVLKIAKVMYLPEGESFQKIRKSCLPVKTQKLKYCMKNRYRDHKATVDVLLGATYACAIAHSVGVIAYRNESRIYWHEQCKSYHLTSKPLRGEIKISDAA